jgi:hypothetical protein
MRRIRLGAATLAPVVGLFVACGGNSSSGSSATSRAADGCGQFFDEVFAGHCATGAAPPANERARVRTRFVELCQDAMTLPGSRMTPGELEACAAAQSATSCDSIVSPPECHITGSLPAGAPCNTGWQCQSGSCSYTMRSADGRPPVVSGCGTCTAAANIGQSCAESGCVQGSACAPSPNGAAPTCVAITAGDAGAHCDGMAALCKVSLYCDPASHTCTAGRRAGASCEDSSHCKAGLACLGKPGAATCVAPAAAGGACQASDGCASGLACARGRCAPVTWASAGQPCGGAARCLVGSCIFDPPRGTEHGRCPTVIADGQPCSSADTTSTCDELSFCVKGVCTLEGSVACE